ncbi:hypothetical protein CPB86DRAFT_785101 [Serendipita vermifera]|nr:hypothetical protein CPB86DRAFT_785101 [Serendipita vermifera]
MTSIANNTDLPAIPKAGDPLHRVIVEKDKVRYLLAYRGVTLVPARDPTNIRPYPGTVRFSINEGSLTSTTLKIYAEDIYLCAGSIFTLPSKSVSIFAKRIFFIKQDPASSNKIVFDLHGADAKGEDYGASSGSPGKDAKPDFPQELPTAGTNGTHGRSNSERAGAGGKFFISAELHCLAQTAIALKVNCVGGRGGRGQAGGNGGAGGNGWEKTDKNVPWNFIRDEYAYYPKFLKAGNGGNGGNGGDGGPGGDGGILFYLATIYSPESSKIMGDIAGATAAGPSGLPGQGGVAGAGGRAGHYQQKIWIGENIDIQGSNGSTGNHGEPGQDGPKTAKEGYMYGLRVPCKILSRPDAIKSICLDPIHMGMVLQRLLFEYQIIYAAQSYDFINSRDQQPLKEQEKEFRETRIWVEECMELLKFSENINSPDFFTKLGVDASIAQDWIKVMFIEQWSTQASARSQLQAAYGDFKHMTKLGSCVDLNQQRLFQIVQPNLAIADLDASIATLKDIEKVKDQFFSAIEKIETAKAQASTAIESLQVHIKDFETDRATLERELQQQEAVVRNANKQVETKKGDTIREIQKFWNTVQRSFTCEDLSAVVGAVGNVLLFAHGPLGAAFKVGAALAVGAASNKVLFGEKSIHTAQGVINKDYLQGQVYLLEANLQDDALMAKITESNAKIHKLSGGDEKFVNAIIADRQSFQTLCNRYFSDPGVSHETRVQMQSAKAVFDEFVNTCQVFHNAVVKYNQKASEYSKLLSDHESVKDQLAAIQAQNYNPSLPLFDLLYAFYNQIYTFQKARVITFLFNAVRCCNGMFLRRCTVLDKMLSLGSLHNITAEILYVACTTDLADDIQRHRDTWNAHPVTEIWSRSTSLHEEKHGLVFERARQHRSFSLCVDTENAISEYGFEPHWFDVRMKDMRVYLIGATNVNESSDNPNSKVIDVVIQMAPYFTVFDEENSQYTFEIPETTTTFSYNYGDDEDDPEPVSEAADRQLQEFSFAMDRSTPGFTMPMRSPICDYVISVGKNVDLTDLREVRVEFDLDVRSRDKDIGGNAA